MDTVGTFAPALDFAGFPADREQIARAAGFAGFAQAQAQEREKGFRELPRWDDMRFFRRGEVGGWRDELTSEQVARIEADHGPMMLRLGYELSAAGAGNIARAG